MNVMQILINIKFNVQSHFCYKPKIVALQLIFSETNLNIAYCNSSSGEVISSWKLMREAKEGLGIVLLFYTDNSTSTKS